MKIYTFNSRNQCCEQIQPNEVIVASLTGDTRSLIVYDTERRMGCFVLPQLNVPFGVNYGRDCKKGFAYENVEYLIDANNAIKKSRPNENKWNLFFDADKRDSFQQFKIQFQNIDEVLDEFAKQGFVLKQ